jgi:hypothetical protein
MATFSDMTATTDWNATEDRLPTSEAFVISHYSTSTPTIVTVSASRALTQVLLIVIGSVGIVANGYVFITIIFCKDVRNNVTNVFICNQTVLDCVACVALTITMVLQKTAASSYAVGFNKSIICIFFDNTAFLGASVYASKYSLVVIALERFFKIVHPVNHRNNLRPWMIKIGIIIPWAEGLFAGIIPSGTMSSLVDGRCRNTLQTYGAGRIFNMFTFVWHFLVPLMIFIFCYANILAVVRRQSRAVGDMTHGQFVAASTSGGLDHPLSLGAIAVKANTSASMTRKETSDVQEGDDQRFSKTEKKIIRTTIMITVCFIICWFPVDFYQATYWLLPQMQASSAGIQFMTLLAYFNVLLNALIYSSHINVLNRTRRAITKLFMRQNANSTNVTGGGATSNIAPQKTVRRTTKM